MQRGSIAFPRKKLKTQNKNGFETETVYDWEGGIPAEFYDVTRNDEILAAQKGYTVSQNIETMACNYHGEAFLYDETSRYYYDIKRTFRSGLKIILSCERRPDGKV